MGLFKRREKDKAASANGDARSPNGRGPFSSMRRANSTPSQNASIPDIPLPKAPDPQIDPAAYLRSIYSVRERSKLVLEKAKRNQLRHFNVDMSKFADTAQYVVSIIKVRELEGIGYFDQADYEVARLCSRLLLNSSSWQVAAF